jgi:hypothetical protein
MTAMFRWVLCFTLVAGLAGCNGSSTTTESAAAPEPAKKPQDPNRPVIAEKGPYPKVVTAETEYDFGILEANQEGKHEFIVRNEGDADMVLKKGPTTCKCTLSEVAETPIPPGGEAKVLLSWKPAPEMNEIRQTAEIYTNDPKRPAISLVILGKLQERLRMMPFGDWPVSDVLEGKNSTLTAFLVSSVVDEFDIVEMESSSPLVKIEKTPITEEQKKEHQAKTGYALKVEVEPKVPVGSFSFPVKFKTNVMGRDSKGELTVPLEFTANVTGKRSGPLRMVGPAFKEHFMALALGTFDATKGQKATISVFVQKAPEEGFQLRDLKVTPEPLKVTFVPDERSTSTVVKRYLLTVEYPAGSPRANHRQDEKTPGIIEAKTNHPDAPDFRIEVYFNAY